MEELDSPEYSQELPSLRQVLEDLEDLVFQEVQWAQQYQVAPSHQGTPRKVQQHHEYSIGIHQTL